MGRLAAAHAAWPQRRGGGLSLVTARHVLGRLLVRARSVSNIPSSGCTYIPPQYDRCCRRQHQRHGRIQERSGLEMYTVPCATSSFLPRRRAAFSRRVGFGRCSPSTISTTPRTSPFPNPRGPLVSILSRSERVRKLLPQLCVCVFCLVGVCRPPPHQDWGRARTAGNRFACDDKEPGPSWGKQLPRERPRETAET